MFYDIAIEPIKVQTHSASQNDRLNLSFVKDKHTEGKKWPEMFIQQPLVTHFHFESDYGEASMTS